MSSLFGVLPALRVSGALVIIIPTSGNFSFNYNKNLAYGYINSELSKEKSHLEYQLRKMREELNSLIDKADKKK